MNTTSLTTLGDELLARAVQAGSGRAAETVHGGGDHVMRQTLLALVAGRELGEHDSPGEAVLQVLRGRVRLTADADAWELATGDHIAIPPRRHALRATEDSVVLLTVALTR